MGKLLELLDSDGFRRHTAMYAGTYDWDGVAQFLRGYQAALRAVDPDPTRLELDGFREWLHYRFDGPGCTDWAGIIQSKFGGGEDATAKFFELLDQFRSDVRKRGLPAILEEHKDYEIKTYGGPVTSRYAALKKVSMEGVKTVDDLVDRLTPRRKPDSPSS